MARIPLAADASRKIPFAYGEVAAGRIFLQSDPIGEVDRAGTDPLGVRESTLPVLSEPMIMELP
jgi:hypothetical protein